MMRSTRLEFEDLEDKRGKALDEIMHTGVGKVPEKYAAAGYVVRLISPVTAST